MNKFITHPGLVLLLPYLKGHAWAFFWGFWLLALTNLTAAAIPYVMKHATDAITRHESVVPFVILLLGLAGLIVLLRIRGRTHVFQIGRQVEFDLRRDYHNHLLQLDATYYDQARTGELVFRGTNDVLAIRMFIGPGFLQVSNTAMAYAITLPVMITMDPWLTLIALSPYPLVMLLARLLTKHLFRLSRQAADRFGELTSLVQESLVGMAVIRNHGQEKARLNLFENQLDRLHHSHSRHTNLQSLYNPLMMFGGGASTLLVVYYGGTLVAQGQLTVGDFVAFSGYLALLIMPTIALGWIITVIQRGLVGLDRLELLLKVPKGVPLVEANKGVARQGNLEVRQLSFAYPVKGEQAGKNILENVSMEVQAGQFVGLVGKVGCGKSTLLHVLAKLYPVPDGTIFLDGEDINALAEEDIRATLAMAPQESLLFSLSVEENLLYGLNQGDSQLAWSLAKQVSLEEEIRRFPQQMQTLVGEKGITLSGGQRQRVALARALAMQAPVLLLDDIFASVDARTEAAILNALMQDHTTTVIMVCHRVAALHQADIIHVMDEGRIIAQGNHAQLMAECSLYQELHNRMARAQALEEL
ncbi:MAG: ABC transporter ATP-binding protein [Magnetococcales bacterium]|nr:ABC transporter ATP-binding protein [Magnetococcales bacterium]NGZ26717.1 ABC transporter ATP-binding protein [Magnetococcales bacterium]